MAQMSTSPGESLSAASSAKGRSLLLKRIGLALVATVVTVIGGAIAYATWSMAVFAVLWVTGWIWTGKFDILFAANVVPLTISILLAAAYLEGDFREFAFRTVAFVVNCVLAWAFLEWSTFWSRWWEALLLAAGGGFLATFVPMSVEDTIAALWRGLSRSGKRGSPPKV
jgi:hypothetical protein